MTNDATRLYAKLPINELRLGDVVQCFEGPFGTGSVLQIADGKVTIERPYGATLDFSYTGGVIGLIGHETIVYDVQSTTTLLVYSRKELR